MSTKELLLLLAAALVVVALAYFIAPQKGPTRQISYERCMNISGKPTLFSSGPLSIVSTDSPGIDTYAIMENGSIAWSMELPGRATAASWWNDKVAIGTDSGYLLVIGKDGSLLSKKKFLGEVQFLSWSEGGRLAVVTRVVEDGREMAMLQLPRRMKLGGYVTYLGWANGSLIVMVEDEGAGLRIIGRGGLTSRSIRGRVLGIRRGSIAISTDGKVALVDVDGRKVAELDVEASTGCWLNDELYIGGKNGLYSYKGSLRRLIKGNVVEIACLKRVAAAIEANGTWFVYVDGKLFEVRGRPFHLQWDSSGENVAFSIQSAEPQTGIIGEELTSLEGSFVGWVGEEVAVYRGGRLCLISPRP
ncbi:MAG: hypothetical protein QI197_05320 [Candidatus Korarchaeota archaeon]|nr:hypothetical protein [Candidatus Korarchaeota archaeon]